MKAEIAKEWVAELRSGKWKQCEQRLTNGEAYCCLGVLCEIAIANGIELEKHNLFYGNCATILPKLVQCWSDMDTPNGSIDNKFCLSRENDDGASFSEIADIIEANVDKL